MNGISHWNQPFSMRNRMQNNGKYFGQIYQEAIANHIEYECIKHNWNKRHLSRFQKLRLMTKIGSRIVASIFHANPVSTKILLCLIGLIPVTSGFSMLGVPCLLIPLGFSDSAVFYENEVKQVRKQYELEKRHLHEIQRQAKRSKIWQLWFGKNIASTISNAKDAYGYQHFSTNQKAWFHLKMLGKLINSFFDVSPVNVGIAGVALGISVGLTGPCAAIPIVLGAVICTILAFIHKKDVVIDFEKRIQKSINRYHNAKWQGQAYMIPSKERSKICLHDATDARLVLDLGPEPYQVSEKESQLSERFLADKAGAIHSLYCKRINDDVLTVREGKSVTLRYINEIHFNQQVLVPNSSGGNSTTTIRVVDRYPSGKFKFSSLNKGG